MSQNGGTFSILSLVTRNVGVSGRRSSYGASWVSFTILGPHLAMSDLRTVILIFTGSLMTNLHSSALTTVIPGASSSYKPCRSFLERLCDEIFLGRESCTDSSVLGVGAEFQF